MQLVCVCVWELNSLTDEAKSLLLKLVSFLLNMDDSIGFRSLSSEHEFSSAVKLRHLLG